MRMSESMTSRPTHLKYAAPVLRVADLARSLSYYCDQLGFTIEFSYEGFYAGVICDGCRIHLKCSGPLEPGQKAFEAGEHLDVCVGVLNAQDLAARFAAAGATFSVPLRRMPYGREFYVKDPDGYILGFIQAEAQDA
jgi:catechol 2,3-dioxygenase-like lactoylglutathione lyase family enzyme